LIRPQPGLLTFDRSDEFSYRTVIGSLGLGGKETAWNFTVPAMISHALAAFAPARTGFIRAGAFFQVFIEIALHNPPHQNLRAFATEGTKTAEPKIKSSKQKAFRILIHPFPPDPARFPGKKKGRRSGLPFFI
jgi:hypothetical protein